MSRASDIRGIQTKSTLKQRDLLSKKSGDLNKLEILRKTKVKELEDANKKEIEAIQKRYIDELNVERRNVAAAIQLLK